MPLFGALTNAGSLCLQAVMRCFHRNMEMKIWLAAICGDISRSSTKCEKWSRDAVLMRVNFKIRLKSLIEFQICYLLVVEMLISVLHFPSIIRYLLDANLLLIALLGVNHHSNWVRLSQSKFAVYYMFLYMVMLVTIGMINLVPIGQLLWAYRNNFFYFMFFFMCIKYLKMRDAERIMGRVIKLRWLNFACAVFEFFVLEAQGDYLGGMFGVEKGCNAYLNMYLVIISAYELARYVEKKSNTANLMATMASSVVLATMGELKVFYVELVTIVLCITLLERKNKKTFFILACGAIALALGMQVLAVVFPTSAELFQNIEKLLEYSTRSDYGNGDIRIARFTVIAQVNDWFFGDNTILHLFGYGFGACEDSQTFSFCNSAFADQYGSIGYRNISSAMCYLETGWIGLIGLMFVFVAIFYSANKIGKFAQMSRYRYLVLFVETVCVITTVNIWYNSAIRRPIAYLTFFVLAMVFICCKELSQATAVKKEVRMSA